MKRLTMAAILLFVFAASARTQQPSRVRREPIPTESVDVGSILVEPEQIPILFQLIGDERSATTMLPDAPVAKVPALPCSAESGKPRVLLEGPRDVSNWHKVRQEEESWGAAMRRPLVIIASALLAASVVADVEGTRACLRENTCKEGNPLLGPRPSQAQVYAFSMPILALEIWTAGRLAKRGHRKSAILSLWIPAVAHSYMAARGYSLASVSRADHPALPAAPGRQQVWGFGGKAGGFLRKNIVANIPVYNLARGPQAGCELPVDSRAEN